MTIYFSAYSRLGKSVLTGRMLFGTEVGKKPKGRRLKTPPLEELMELLGHEFNNPRLLERALTHSSYANESGTAEDYEQLEFLGDAVLELVVSDMLVARFPEYKEGELSRVRASAVNRNSLASIAQHLELGQHLRLSFGEEKTGGREKSTILADVFESIIGAIYLDGGFGAAASFIERYIDMLLEGDRRQFLFTDYKTRLQELAQARLQAVPSYRTVSSTGPDHDKTFEIEVFLANRMYGRGVGKSKKEAEQRAAQQAFEELTGGRSEP